RAMTAQLCPDWGSEFASTYAPELDGPLPLSRRVWSAAALGALLLHLWGAAPTDTKNPKDDPKTPPVQAMPSEQSAAAEATAMPSVENAPESTSSLAPPP